MLSGRKKMELSTAVSVLIDIPIGLRREHREERLCNKMVRAVLQPERGSSVFPAPSRRVGHGHRQRPGARHATAVAAGGVGRL